MKTPHSYIARIDEYRRLLENLAVSKPGEEARAIAVDISARFEEDVKYANSSKRMDALSDDERDALDCIREYWAKDKIDLRKDHAEWMRSVYSLLDYLDYYDHHNRPKK